jgi:ankyrin repeat protein
MGKKIKFHSLLLPIAFFSGCDEQGSMAMAERSGSGAGSEAMSPCNARTDELSPMRDERSVFPNPQDHEKLVIYRAIRCRDDDQVRKLLESGLDPNTDLNGAALSYWAAMSGSIPILKMLLERGANIDGQEGDFSPGPLQGAIGYSFGIDDWSVYEFLLAQGANPEIRSGNPTLTTAEYLTMTGRYDKIDELLDRGYDRDLIMLRQLVETRIEVSRQENKERGRRLLERLNDKLR